MPKPNLSNRGTTLLLLMLKRGTKTRVIALQVLIRIWATLANEWGQVQKLSRGPGRTKKWE